MRFFRALIATLGLIWLVPLPGLLSHTSANGVIAGRYTPGYFAFLVAYLLVWVALAVLAVRAGERTVTLLTRPLRWLRRHPILVVLLLYGLVELWYGVRRTLLSIHFFGEDERATLNSLLVFTGLLAIYAAGVLIFAGRSRDELRNTLANAVLVLISSAVALVAFSFGYALVIHRQAYSVGHTLWAKYVQRDPVLGYTIRPNQDGLPLYFQEEDRYIPTSSNGIGFRSIEEMADAPVAGVGDSFLFGFFVSDDQLWSLALSRELGVPVANYGVFGYQLWQYNLVADRYIRQAHHRLVIYGIFANDLRDDRYVEKNIRLLQHWEMWAWQSPINYTLDRLLAESPAYQIAGLGSMSRPRPVVAPSGMTSSCVPQVVAIGGLDRLIGERLDRAIALSEEIGYTLLVVTIPSKEAVYEELIDLCGPQMAKSIAIEQHSYTALCEYLAGRGVPCYDVSADMRQAAQDEEGWLYFRVDAHWNPRGHEVFAALLADYITKHHLLD